MVDKVDIALKAGGHLTVGGGRLTLTGNNKSGVPVVLWSVPVEVGSHSSLVTELAHRLVEAEAKS